MSVGRAPLTLLAAILVACGPDDDRPRPVPSHAGIQPDHALLAFESESMPPWSKPGGFYRYAPSIVEVAPGVRYAWACGNVRAGEVKDHLIARKATNVDGAWSWEGETVALAPTEERDNTACTGFDCYHTCDPELIEGDFANDGARHRYAMLYTGNDLDQSAHCAVGVAFADSLDGPFVRKKLPLVPYPCDDGPSYSWGVGQPTATTIDEKGRFHLFARLECGKVSRPVHYVVDLGVEPPRVDAQTDLTMNGLTTPTGAPDGSLNNASIVYDPWRDMFHAVRSQHPMPTTIPKALARSLQIDTIEGGPLLSGGGTWEPLASVAPDDDRAPTWISGHSRNSNPGLVRTSFGRSLSRDRLEIAYTASDEGDGLDWLWSKGVHVVSAQLLVPEGVTSRR